MAGAAAQARPHGPGLPRLIQPQRETNNEPTTTRDRFILLAVASASLTIENLTIFRVATAVVIGLGFSAANQLYGLAGSVTARSETGNAMGIVSLGAGLFGYFGPQMLGILRDWTGSFAAGFYMVAIADVITLGLIALLYRINRAPRARHLKEDYVCAE